jgi:hypothetical protein
MMGLLLMMLAATVAEPGVACPVDIQPGAAVHAAARTPNFKFALPVGGPTRLLLAPANSVRLAAKSPHAAAATSSAGLAAIDVERAGKLQVRLSSKTYVDLLRNGTIVAASSHARYTANCPLHKSVTFSVTPGR